MVSSIDHKIMSNRMRHNFDVPLQGHVNASGDWHPAGGYIVWTAAREATEPAMSLLELHDRAVVRLPDDPRVLHVTPARRAHHLTHGFGFWRRSGADLLFLRIEEPVFSSTRYVMMVPLRAATDYREEEIFWVCPHCGAEMQNQRIRAGAPHFLAFWRLATEATRLFNENTHARTCNECGEIHPLGYGISPKEDTEIEAAARLVW